MLEFEREELAEFLNHEWRGKYTPNDLAYWCRVFDACDLDSVKGVVTHWKNTERFAPKAGDIARRMGVELPKREAAPSGTADLSFAEVIRKHNPHLASVSDVEAIIRFWRGQWMDYMHRLNRRWSGVPATPKSQRARDLAVRQARGFWKRCQNGCMGSLTAAVVTFHAAQAWSNYLRENPDDFRTALDELRMDGIDMAPAEPMEADLSPAFSAMELTEPSTPYRAVRELVEAEHQASGTESLADAQSREPARPVTLAGGL